MPGFECEYQKNIVVANELDTWSFKGAEEEEVFGGRLDAMPADANLGEAGAVSDFGLAWFDSTTVHFHTFHREIPESGQLLIDPDGDVLRSVTCTHLFESGQRKLREKVWMVFRGERGESVGKEHDPVPHPPVLLYRPFECRTLIPRPVAFHYTGWTKSRRSNQK